MSNNPNSVVVWGGGANQPLISSLNTLNTLKNSNPKELVKNLNKIQNSNQLDLNHLNELKDSRLDLIQLESKIQDLKNLNQLKESKNLNKIQEINFSKESKKLNSIKLETKIKVSNLDLNLQKDSNLSKVSKVLRYRRWREAMNKYIIDT